MRKAKTNSEKSTTSDIRFVQGLSEMIILLCWFLENNQYLLCSGGDDGAVTFASFKVRTVENKLDVFLWNSISIPDAHTSAATGALSNCQCRIVRCRTTVIH